MVKFGLTLTLASSAKKALSFQSYIELYKELMKKAIYDPIIPCLLPHWSAKKTK